MKKKEIIIFGIIFVIGIILSLGVSNGWFSNKNNDNLYGVYHEGELILEFDPYKDGYHTFSGSYGEMHLEIKDGAFRVIEVECPNHLCENQGWIDAGSDVPITCVPNEVVIKKKSGLLD